MVWNRSLVGSAVINAGLSSENYGSISRNCDRKRPKPLLKLTTEPDYGLEFERLLWNLTYEYVTKQYQNQRPS
ncbi:unnamed protein product [Trifolium pratense]|uniref:Uncharacterized protein n=1 Tax=Trifolium pratense TaxID=57577 RepID=A0ACB0K0K9_TRIPR|nr:unnamed protein product [Trifolium pratense]